MCMLNVLNFQQNNMICLMAYGHKKQVLTMLVSTIT